MEQQGLRNPKVLLPIRMTARSYPTVMTLKICQTVSERMSNQQYSQLISTWRRSQENEVLSLKAIESKVRRSL
jgi:hypothetical protein